MGVPGPGLGFTGTRGQEERGRVSQGQPLQRCRGREGWELGARPHWDRELGRLCRG